MATPADRQLPGLGALIAALEDDQLFLVYQPMFDLRRGRIASVEAQLRWRDPARGVVTPDAFMPFAEEAGLTGPIGRWVLRAACAQGAAWRDAGHPIAVAVSLSARQFDNRGLLEDVAQALDASGLHPATLTLEFSERTLTRDHAVTGRRLTDLKALGVRIAVDDVAGGEGSLAYLGLLPIDALKVDRALISDGTGHESHVVVRMIVRLGRLLGIETYAAAIEDRDQLAWLRGERCHAGRGYLFARPLPPDELAEMLAAEPPSGVLYAA